MHEITQGYSCMGNARKYIYIYNIYIHQDKICLIKKKRRRLFWMLRVKYHAGNFGNSIEKVLQGNS